MTGLPTSREPAYLSASMLDLLERAAREAERERSGNVSTEHLLNALSQEIRGPAGEILGAMGIAPGSLRGHLSALRSVPRPTPKKALVGTLTTDQYTHDWVEDARADRLDPVLGRDVEVRRLTTILERRQKNNTLLVGEPGVGKGAVVAALAQRIADGDVPTTLAGVRLLELDAAALVAGTRLRSDVDERMRGLLVVAVGRQTRTAGAGGARSGADLRTGPRGRGGRRLPEIPAARAARSACSPPPRPEGLRKVTEKDPTVLRAFTSLPIDEPSVDGAIEILRGVASRYEERHQVEISEGAIGTAVRLAKRYLQDRFLPDSAIDLLDETAAAKRVDTDGIPAPVDTAMRRADSLKAQIRSLERSEDKESKTTRDRLSAELAELEPKLVEMKSKLESRRGAVAAVRTLKSELDAARASLEDARTRKDFAKLGELEHVTVPELEKRHRAAEEAARSAGLLDENSRVVAESDVAGTLGGLDRRPGGQDARGRSRQAAQDGGAAREARRRARRGRQGHRPSRPPRTRRPPRSGQAHRQLPLPRAERRRQDRARQGAGGVPLRRRARAHPPRHERVHGAPHGAAPDRRAAGLRRQRSGRLPHRGRASPSLLGAALRRGREGAPRRVQPLAAGARRRSPHRRTRSHRGLLQHRRDHDQQHRIAAHPRDRSQALRERGGSRGPARRAARASSASSSDPSS